MSEQTPRKGYEIAKMSAEKGVKLQFFLPKALILISLGKNHTLKICDIGDFDLTYCLFGALAAMLFCGSLVGYLLASGGIGSDGSLVGALALAAMLFCGSLGWLSSYRGSNRWG